MKDCRERALVLFELGEISRIPEHKTRAVAIAQMWLTLAVLEDALALWADEVKKQVAMH